MINEIKLHQVDSWDGVYLLHFAPAVDSTEVELEFMRLCYHDTRLVYYGYRGLWIDNVPLHRTFRNFLCFTTRNEEAVVEYTLRYA